MKSLLIIFLFCAAFGCAMAEQKLSTSVNYQKDISLEINGEKFTGVAVPKKASQYEIKIKARGKIDMLTITTCHREEKFEEPSSGWFSSGKSFTYIYKPNKDIEDTRGCMLDIGAYEKLGGRHSWGVIDFETLTETLASSLKCNGVETRTRGSSICQAKAGLVQKIEFTEVVKTSPDSEICSVMTSEDGKSFTYIMPLGECTFFFGTKDGKFHRHTTYGYESILIRGE